MTDTDNPGFGSTEPVDMTESNNDNLSNAERNQRAATIYDRILDGRGQSESVTLETAYGDIECLIDLGSLDRSTRWDCLKALPDGMFEAANEEEEDESDISLSSSAIPGGDGVEMLELILKKTLSAKQLSDGELESLIENDLNDAVVIQLGMRILEMSFDRGQVSGFRLD